MKPSSCKAKGRNFQNWVVEQIRNEFNLAEDDVRGTSMGAGGEDIQFSSAARGMLGEISIECKCQERLNLFDAWQQTKANARHYHPLLVVKKNHSDVLCILHWEHLIHLIKEGSKQIEKNADLDAISLPAPKASAFEIANWLRLVAHRLENTA